MTLYEYPTTPLAGVSVQALAWLRGAWQGTFQTDEVDEYWSHAEAGTIVGVYRWVHEGKPELYEMMLIEQEGDGVVARFKHFDPGLKAKEEADQHYGFNLVALEGDSVIFHMRDYTPDVWLFYRREGDTLITYYQIQDREPTPVEQWWRYQRQD